MDQSTLNYIIQTLEEAIQVSYSAPDREDYGYAYATGYSRTAMKCVLQVIREVTKK